MHTVGESPVCSFIAWRLSVGDYSIGTIGSLVVDRNKDTIFWKSEKYADYDYKPVFSYENFNQSLEEHELPDIILLSASTISEFTEISNNLKTKVKVSTIIMIDATHANGLETIVLNKVPNNIVLSVISEVTIKTIEYETKIVYHHLGNKVATMVGISISNPPNHIYQALEGNSTEGKLLLEICDTLQSNGIYPCNIVQVGVKPSINSFIWKRIFAFLVFDVLTLIYGNLNLSQGKSSIVKNLFEDLIELAANDCKEEIPGKKDTQKVDIIFNQVLDQFNKRHTKYKVHSTNGNIEPSGLEILEMPLCIHNFTGNFSHQIQLCFDQCLNHSTRLNIAVPYIECIETFYKEIEVVQSQKVFDWITKTSYRSLVPVSNPLAEHAFPINKGFNNSETSIFNSRQNGSNTPMTPMSNTVPPGYTFYPELNVMLPNGINPEMLRNPPVYNNQHKENYASVPKKAEHPRFKDLPENDVHGKKVYFKQIKTLAYPSTKGSTAPEALVQAQKHLYQYSNLNGIFETINNRYGTADSLEIFKLSSGFKPDDDGEEGNIEEQGEVVLIKGNYQNDVNERASTSGEDTKAENNSVSFGDDDDDDDDFEEMADADENID